MIDVCCLLEVRWGGHIFRMVEMIDGDTSCAGLKREMELVVWE